LSKQAVIAEDLHAFSGFNVGMFAGKHASEVAGGDARGFGARGSRTLRTKSYSGAGESAVTCDSNCALRGCAGGGAGWRSAILVAQIRSSKRCGARIHRSAGRHLAGFELQTKSFVVAAGCDAWAKSAAETRAEGNFGNRPLIVLTAGRAFAVGAPQAGEELKAFHEIWTHQLQVRPTQLSTQGGQVVVENSGHGIGWEAPGAVVDAIHDVVTQARNQATSE
jgi:hypothetical protein